jgi:hypothetical protein
MNQSDYSRTCTLFSTDVGTELLNVLILRDQDYHMIRQKNEFEKLKITTELCNENSETRYSRYTILA